MDRKAYEFISNKTWEKIVEMKKCSCWQDFAITDKDLVFYEKISPTFKWKKYTIPSPTLCPDCRLQRRLSFRNERSLYKSKSSLTWNSIISMYSPDKPYKVFEQNEWWSDKWNPIDYWRDFDFSRSFFEQFRELQNDVPRSAMLTSWNENSDYTNYSSYLKNCYLLFDCSNSNDSYYWYNQGKADSAVDTSVVSEWSNLYECIDWVRSHRTFFTQNCSDCSDWYFLSNCSGCKSCIWCNNLINKEYYVENEFVWKEKFEEMLVKIKSNFNYYKDYYKKLSLKYPKQNAFLVQTENVFGNWMISSTNCVSCYDWLYFEDAKYCSNWADIQDSYDCESIWISARRCYELNAAMQCENVLFSFWCWGSYVWYSDVSTWNNLFWCVWIHSNQSYCILNKQYTKSDYEELVPRIIEHMQKTWEWWEFFPSSISPFWYNETVALEYFPLSKKEAITKWFNWSDYENPKPDVSKIIPASKLPEDISSIPDDILNWAIECEVSGKLFRIIKPELEFYRKHNIPVPRRHPDQRHLDRMNKRAPRKLFLRNCSKCWIEIISVYDKNSEYKVYCEECYNKEVY